MSGIQKPSGRSSPPNTPWWVIAFVVILILLAAIVVIAHLMGFRLDHGTGSILFHSVAGLVEHAAQDL